MHAQPASAAVAVGVSIGPTFGPPAPIVERYGVRPGYVWAPGYWRWYGGRYRWHAGYWVHGTRRLSLRAGALGSMRSALVLSPRLLGALNLTGAAGRKARRFLRGNRDLGSARRWVSIVRVSLRLQINLLIAVLIATFVGVVFAFEVISTRNSVREEVQAGNVVAAQLVSNFDWNAAGANDADRRLALVNYLARIGRVRANDITLFDETGKADLSFAAIDLQGRTRCARVVRRAGAARIR